MLDWVLTRVRRTKHGGNALRVFLWWGFGVRAVLLIAMLTLLVVRGNFLARWLWSLDLLLVPTADIGKLTVASYVLLAGFLTVGALIRWGILARLDAPATAAGPEALDPQAPNPQAPDSRAPDSRAPDSQVSDSQAPDPRAGGTAGEAQAGEAPRRPGAVTPKSPGPGRPGGDRPREGPDCDPE
jgi:hypothetical protein